MANILLVDDDAEWKQILQFYLEQRGYGVLSAGDGRAALDVLKLARVDVILLDVMLPDLDGLETLRALRENRPGVPIIIISCVTDHRRIELFLQEGARDYLTKPVAMGDMVDAIERSLCMTDVHMTRR